MAQYIDLLDVDNGISELHDRGKTPEDFGYGDSEKEGHGILDPQGKEGLR